MRCTIQVDMGCQDDRFRIGVHWFDHNNYRHLTVVEIKIQEQDKPREIEIGANTVDDDDKLHPDEVDVIQVYGPPKP